MGVWNVLLFVKAREDCIVYKLTLYPCKCNVNSKKCTGKNFVIHTNFNTSAIALDMYRYVLSTYLKL